MNKEDENELPNKVISDGIYNIIEEYLEKKGYSIIETSELNHLYDIKQNHPR